VTVKTEALIGTLLLCFSLFAGCQGFESARKRTPQDEESQPQPLRPRKKREFLEIERSYDLETLLIPVLQLNNLLLSFDYYPQFVWDGDPFFTEYLLRVFSMDSGPFRLGEGAVLEAGYENTGIELRVERLLLGHEEDGAWWQVRHAYLGEEVQYEVFVADPGIPRIVRYTDPRTGALQEAVPLFDDLPDDAGVEDLEVRLETKRRTRIEKDWQYAFNDPEILGEELVQTGTGQFMTVHVRDRYDDEYGSGADYWISPDVPGQVVKIEYSGQGQPSYVIMLQALTFNALEE
jgi:hypothetical protein